MKTYIKTFLVFVFIALFVALLYYVTRGASFPILHPAGSIAIQERNLILIATALMLAVVIPVFALTALIAWRYRSTNTSAKYLPNWEHNYIEEFIWWAIPCIIIIVLANITWRTTHELDPFRPITGNELHIQAVALDWKWLFIYPEEGIASVNFVEFPAGTPVRFSITSDAPMNSFWIPSLAGQIYAMTGMKTNLHVITNTPGSYYGMSSNLSGKGFAGMHFIAKAVPRDEYDAWVLTLKSATSTILDSAAYDALAKPSVNEPVRYYGGVQHTLFESILEKYMDSMPGMEAMHDMMHM